VSCRHIAERFIDPQGRHLVLRRFLLCAVLLSVSAPLFAACDLSMVVSSDRREWRAELLHVDHDQQRLVGLFGPRVLPLVQPE
jgi:hypothetical protein